MADSAYYLLQRNDVMLSPCIFTPRVYRTQEALSFQSRIQTDHFVVLGISEYNMKVPIPQSHLAYIGILKIMPLVLVFCLMQTVQTLSADSVQVTTKFEMCTFETFEFHLCTEGRAKIHPASCSTPCCACPRGTFMDKFNNCTECQPMTDCKAEGKEVLLEGSPTHDAVCGDYLSPTTLGPQLVTSTQGATSSDGATTSSSSTETNSTSSHHGDEDGNYPWAFIIVGSLCIIALALIVIVFICNPDIPEYLHGVLCGLCSRSKRTNRMRDDGPADSV